MGWTTLCLILLFSHFFSAQIPENMGIKLPAEMDPAKIDQIKEEMTKKVSDLSGKGLGDLEEMANAALAKGMNGNALNTLKIISESKFLQTADGLKADTTQELESRIDDTIKFLQAMNKSKELLNSTDQNSLQALENIDQLLAQVQEYKRKLKSTDQPDELRKEWNSKSKEFYEKGIGQLSKIIAKDAENEKSEPEKENGTEEEGKENDKDENKTEEDKDDENSAHRATLIVSVLCIPIAFIWL